MLCAPCSVLISHINSEIFTARIAIIKNISSRIKRICIFAVSSNDERTIRALGRCYTIAHTNLPISRSKGGITPVDAVYIHMACGKTILQRGFSVGICSENITCYSFRGCDNPTFRDAQNTMGKVAVAGKCLTVFINKPKHRFIVSTFNGHTKNVLTHGSCRISDHALELKIKSVTFG